MKAKESTLTFYNDIQNLTKEQAAEAWRLLFNVFVDQHDKAERRAEIARKNRTNNIKKQLHRETEDERNERHFKEATGAYINICNCLYDMEEAAHRARIGTGGSYERY